MEDIGMPAVIFEPVHPDFEKVYYEGNTGYKWPTEEGADVASADCLPRYSFEGDSGFDVRAMEDIVISPGQGRLLKLGFKMAIPKHKFHDYGYRYECQCRPRSGVSMKTMLRVSNAPGTIDNFYTGEVGVLLTNIGGGESGMPIGIDGSPQATDFMAPYGSYVIRKGDRIAQLVFAEVVRPKGGFMIGKVESVRDGGFGSTGVNVLPK